MSPKRTFPKSPTSQEISDDEVSLPCGRPRPERPEVPGKTASDSWRERLQTHVTEKGLKSSEQREKIVELILTNPGHFSIQNMVKKVQEAYPGIGTATVYRNVKLLCEASILKETLMNDEGQVVYELSDDTHHDHIICLDCGEIFEFHEAGIEKLQQQVTRKLGFKESWHRHVIYTRCEYKPK